LADARRAALGDAFHWTAGKLEHIHETEATLENRLREPGEYQVNARLRVNASKWRLCRTRALPAALHAQDLLEWHPCRGWLSLVDTVNAGTYQLASGDPVFGWS
jgi:hypothetical protein